MQDENRELQPEGLKERLGMVRMLRDALSSDMTIIASGGIHSPADALATIEAGASLVQLDSGFVFSGPGLAKRSNEAILDSLLPRPDESTDSTERTMGLAWFWTFLMGLAMTIGGGMAMMIASTRVVLPYDEAISGISREELFNINQRLVDFMRHDRVTLAGTMFCDGILYCVLSYYGSRRGLRWANTAICSSAMVGFFSFFLFLGFGYFDPFHAFVTAILFQFLLLAMHSPVLPQRMRVGITDLENDWAWRFNQWGQLLFVIHGAMLVVAGIVICKVGISTVFVPEDVEFMRTTMGALRAADPNLVPLIAHDRATFGGMLISCGIVVLLAALWGFKRGYHWLWWALMIAGNLAYLSTLIVHWQVGYTSPKHLLPAYAGLAMLWVGGLLSRPFLCARPKSVVAS